MSNTRYIKTNTSDGSETCNDGKLGSLGYQKLQPVIYRKIRVNGIVMAVPVIQNLPDLSVVRGVEDVGDKNGVKWEIPDCSSSVVIYRLRDTNNNILDSGSVECGETLELTAPDSTYTIELNGVNIEVGSILSGENKLIEITTTCDDANFSLINSNNVEILNGNIASGTSEIIIAPDSSYLVQYQDGTEIDSGTIESGGSATINVPPCHPATITLNGNSFISVDSGDSENITLIDQNGNTITPLSVVNAEIEVEVPLKEVFIKGIFQEGQFDLPTITIDADNIGTFDTLTQDGNSGTITFEVNGVAETLPFSLSIGDELDASRTDATSVGFYKIGGDYV